MKMISAGKCWSTMSTVKIWCLVWWRWDI